MHVNIKPVSEYPWYLRPFFWNQKRKYGAVLDAGLVWGRVPKIFMAVALLYGAFNRSSSPLNPALRSLITVRVSQINSCAFCVDINSATLLKRGVPLEKVEALQAWRESSFFDEKERVALGYAEAMTFSHTKVDEEMIGELRRYFDDEAMVELTGLIGFQNMSSKFNSALSVPPQGFCQIPKSKLLDETVPETPHADSALEDRQSD